MNPSTINLAVLQLNLRVGDTLGNAETTLKGYRNAVANGASFVMAPELTLTGYPPKDNLLYGSFLMATAEAEAWLVAEVGDTPLAFGTLRAANPPGDYGQRCTNAYVVAQNGRIIFETHKRYLAQGGVFDEWRVHTPGTPRVFVWQGLTIGFPICEDIWHHDAVDDVVAALESQGAQVLLVPNGSPTYIGKPAVRHALVEKHVRTHGVPMLYLNHVGGQDEHVFDGGAFFCNPATQPKAQTFAPYWEEGAYHVALNAGPKGWSFASTERFNTPPESDYALSAIVVGTRDYLLKSSSLRKVVIGVSGGVDSAVVLGIAVLVMRALGLNPAENILAVSMPSRHNSATTQGFAQQVCDNLGVPLHWWPIEDAVNSLRAGYSSVFGESLKASGNVADENAQSRERGQMLMAISNRQNALLLSTGNKSEMAMGYATLYGDMNGGFNPLKTLYKTQVYALGHTLNRTLAALGYGDEAIPNALIHQRPSAELADNQFDENSLPPYPVLDAILQRFLDQRLSVAEIVGGSAVYEIIRYTDVHFAPANDAFWDDRGYLTQKPPFQRFNLTKGYGHIEEDVYTVHPDCILAVAQQLLRMRFKRYQACPGVTITAGSFDDGEKFPLANATTWLAQGLETTG